MKAAFYLMIIWFILEKNEEGEVSAAELQITGLNFSNHSKNATVDEKQTDTTIAKNNPKVGEGSSRSEVYKMHANGLMLLHAQRPRSGIGAKKSDVNKSISSINYHVRKKINDTSNYIAEAERRLEAKLGDLPQVVHHKRSIGDSNEIIGNRRNRKKDKSIINNLCLEYSKTETIDCPRHTVIKKHHRRRKHQWKSIVQGEDSNGNDVKKTKVYPEKISDKSMNFNEDKHVFRRRNIIVDPHLILTERINGRTRRLRKALSMMDHTYENPLFDRQQEGVTMVDQNTEMDMSDIRELGNLHNRGLAEPISDIQPIIPIRNSMEKLESPIKYPPSPHHRLSIDEYPRFGDPKLKLGEYPQFVASKRHDLFERIPRLLRIKPIRKEEISIAGIKSISRDDGEEFEGEKRDYPSKNNIEGIKPLKSLRIEKNNIDEIIPFSKINGDEFEGEKQDYPSPDHIAEIRPMRIGKYTIDEIKPISKDGGGEFEGEKLEYPLQDQIGGIRPLSRGDEDELQGEKRQYTSKDQFVDEELERGIEHIHRLKEIIPPTPITDITSISEIPSLTDIPTIPPAANGATVKQNHKDKMPLVQTVDTVNGKETRISA